MVRDRTDYLAELGRIVLGSRVRRLSDRWMGDVARVYRREKASFNPTWFPLFRLIGDRGEVTVVAASRMLGLTHPAVSQFCNELVRAKLVATGSDAKDQRKRVMRLSPAGRRMYAKLTPIWNAVDAAMADLMRECEVDLLDVCDRFERAYARRSVEERVDDHLGGGEPAIQIVDFEPRYAKAFRDLNLRWLTDGRQPEPIDLRMLRFPETEIIAGGGMILVALCDGEPAGVAALLCAGKGRFELSKMAVAPQRRGRGIGRKLLEACIARARQAGADEIVLETDHALAAAVRLYRSAGFIEGPLPKQKKFARSELAMTLHLNSTSVPRRAGSAERKPRSK